MAKTKLIFHWSTRDIKANTAQFFYDRQNISHIILTENILAFWPSAWRIKAKPWATPCSLRRICWHRALCSLFVKLNIILISQPAIWKPRMPLLIFPHSEYLTYFRADKFQVKEHKTCTLISNIKVCAKNVSIVATGGFRNDVAEFRFFSFLPEGFLSLPIAFFPQLLKHFCSEWFIWIYLEGKHKMVIWSMSWIFRRGNIFNNSASCLASCRERNFWNTMFMLIYQV